MALNPYTLNHLYEKGIIDYVPTDLMMPTPVGNWSQVTNPYLNLAAQGNLYQNHGVQTDSFHSSYTPAYTPNDYRSVSSSANSYVGVNNGGYSGSQIGSRSNAGGWNTFNGYGVGTYNRNSIASSFGEDGSIGYASNTGILNTVGGIDETKNNIISGFNKASATVSNAPKMILGLIAGTIGIISIAALFKRGKSVGKNFFSKLNPKNWSWFSKKNSI